MPSHRTTPSTPTNAPCCQRVRRARPALALVGAALLAACGGGGDGSDGTGATSATSMESAQAVSADATTVAADGGAALLAAVSTAELVVGSGQATQTIDCAGGGNASFTVSGGTLLQMANGSLDTGEVYTLAFVDCRGSDGAASITGSLTLDVVEASDGHLVVDTATRGIVITLPQATITLDGSSRLTRDTTASGSTTTQVGHWSTPSIRLVRSRSGTIRSHTLSDVDLTGTVVASGGIPSSSSLAGSATVARSWPNGSYEVTLTINGSAQYGSDGLPTAGSWSLQLPDDLITLQLAGGSATVSVDLGDDGSIDRSWTWTTTTLVDGAP